MGGQEKQPGKLQLTTEGEKKVGIRRNNQTIDDEMVIHTLVQANRSMPMRGEGKKVEKAERNHECEKLERRAESVSIYMRG